jgi:putative membrane protein
MMWYWSGQVHWWGWFLGFLGMVVFWGLIVWAIWYVVAGATRRGEHAPARGELDAKRILDERLARGEISPQEYEHLRDLMRGWSSPSTPGGRGGPVPAGHGS